MPSPRTVAAVTAGKLAGGLSRGLGRGGGTALPGIIAERIDPHLLRRMTRQLGHGSVIVTGTNGKTTTARMLAAIAETSGFAVIHNRSGSNLMRGLTTAAVESATAAGRVPQAARSLGVFEVDEATLLQGLPQLQPRVVVFTNLFRDQLDRYGEVDSILAIWREALGRLRPSATVVLNADDPSVASLASCTPACAVFYGIDDPNHAGMAEHAADARWCLRCGAEYQYAALYYGHLGLWRCPGCGSRRPTPEHRAGRVLLAPGAGATLEVDLPTGAVTVSTEVGGLYSAYNALAAVTAASVLGLSHDVMAAGLARFRPAFGRQERMSIRGREVHVLLCKNPAGTNQALRQLASDGAPLRLVIALNDGIADGRDVSWIWDADFELLAGRVATAVVSGRRGADMALRLKYAGLDQPIHLETNISRAIESGLAATPQGARLYVLPTYTAMLAAREHLAPLGRQAHYWEE